MNPYKIYVAVGVRFDREGRMTPLWIEWEDGRTYSIDAVRDVRRAASMKAGGTGLRYLCSVGGRQRHLYYEGPRWFVPAKGLEEP